MPGRIIMMDTMVPSSRRKEKARRLMVELYVEGQHPDRRQGAEPHKHDAYRETRNARRELARHMHRFIFNGVCYNQGHATEKTTQKL